MKNTSTKKSVKNVLLIFAATILCLPFARTASALEDPMSNQDMIEIGAGAGQAGKTVDVLFHIQGQKTSSTAKNGGYFVLARIQADFATTGKTLSFVDIDFQALGGGHRWDAEVTRGFIEYNLLSASLHKDLSIDENYTAELNFVGIRAGAEVYFQHGLAAYVKGAANLLGIAMTERASDRAKFSGLGESAMAELGLRFREKYRVAIGVKTQTVLGDRETIYPGTVSCYEEYIPGYEWCDEEGYCYYEEGYYETHCTNDHYTISHKKAWRDTYYVEFHADLSRNMSLFAGAGYSVFRMEDDKGEFSNSKKAGWRFKVGASYRF